MTNWKPSQIIILETDPSLGAAHIVESSDSSVFKIRFLNSGEERNYSKKNPPFKRVKYHVGQKLTSSEIGEVTIEEIFEHSDPINFRSNKGLFDESSIVKMELSFALTDLIRQMQVSQPKSFLLRKKCSELLDLRLNHSLKGLVGCRIELMPHQLWTAHTITKSAINALGMNEPIRALIADEVGLGKTIEAGLVFSALHAQKSLNKVLILVPEALKIQWLTEFYRRFHVKFRLDHEETIDDEDHRDFVIASLENLEKNISEFDLLIVDEAHRLSKDPEKRVLLEAIIKNSKHVIFLSATPQIYGSAAYVEMLELLSPEGKAQVFQTKRSEINWPCRRRLETQVVPEKIQWIKDFLKNQSDLKKNEKVFLITSSKEQVIELHKTLVDTLGPKFALFHEGMDLVERDRQAAYFANPDGAPFLLSSEIGGEGRNFQFCKNLVLLDIPSDPLTVEQRIGRLDRIGQQYPISIWCPVVENSLEEKNFQRLRDHYKVFEKPWTGAGEADFGGDIDDLDSSEFVNLRLDSKNAIFKKFDHKESESLLKGAKELAQTNIEDVLESIYDIFGIEIEDLDSFGTWKIALTAQSFVDYFPGLEGSEERSVTFKRHQALVHENYSFYSIDHPVIIDTVELFLNTNEGKFTICKLNSELDPELYLLLQISAPKVAKLQHRLWAVSEQQCSAVNAKEFARLTLTPDSPSLFPWKNISPNFFEQIALQLEKHIALKEEERVDSLMAICPTKD